MTTCPRITDLLKTERMVADGRGGLQITGGSTLADWFDGEPLPTVVAIGTASKPDMLTDDEQMAIIREYAKNEDVDEAWELVDADGCFAGIVRLDGSGWTFISPGVMA